MKSLILIIVLNSSAIASEGKEHSHSIGGELEHAWPIAAFFIIVVIAGIAYNQFTKKK